MNENETQPEADRSHETNVAGGSSKAQIARQKSHREKRQELHNVLTEIVAREARQQRLRDGTSTEKDARTEARAIEDDARAKSRRILASTTQAR